MQAFMHPHKLNSNVHKSKETYFPAHMYKGVLATELNQITGQKCSEFMEKQLKIKETNQIQKQKKKKKKETKHSWNNNF